MFPIGRVCLWDILKSRPPLHKACFSIGKMENKPLKPLISKTSPTAGVSAQSLTDPPTSLDGAPFDPLTATPPDFARGLEEREIGGLGIHLIRKMMDTVRYKRCGDKNIVTICKKR